MSSGNYSVNVPKLKGRENYDDWAFAAENFMILEGVDVTSAAGLSEADNKKARAKIIMTIDPSLFVHIKTEATVQDLWAKLKSLFDDRGFTRKITLLRSLISIRLESCDSMTSYVNQIVETAQRLKGTGFEINDEWIGSLLLAGLPERFSPMIMAIEHSGLKISADAIKTKLMDMSSEFEVKSEGALIAHCRQKRHLQAHSGSSKNEMNEMNQLPVSGNVNVSTTQKKQIRCYHCKKIGHFKSQCRLLNKDNKQKSTSNVLSAVFLTREFNQDDWYVDSGASAHMVSNKNLLTNISYEPKVKEIIVADRTKVPVLCSGDIRLTTRVKTITHEVEIKNVLCIPTLTTNLLSVSRMIANGNRVSFNKNGCYIYNTQNVCIGEASLENDVYRLNIDASKQLLAAVAQTSCNTWHRRLGHINMNDLEKMKKGAVKGVTYQDKQNISQSSCVVCCEGKQSRLPFSASTSTSSRVLEVVHTDLCGPMEKKSLGLARYYLLFVDDYSRMCFVYFLKEKNEAFKYFREFKQHVENQQSQKIKILRSDNGGEFCSAEMENYLKRHGIIHQKTVPYTPEQNGLSERYNRSIVEKARCLLYDASFDKHLWAEAVNTAVYLKNCSPAAALNNNSTPYEMWTGRKPNLQHIRVFGSPVMVHIPKVRRNKWDKKSQMLYLVGYSENTKGYRLYDQKTNKIIVARDVVVMESPMNDTVEAVVEEREPDKSIEKNTSIEEESSTSIEDNERSREDPTYIASDSSSDQDDEYSECLMTDDSLVATQSDAVTQKEKRVRRVPERYGISNMCVEDFTSEQISLQDALTGPNREHWCSAMQEELKSLSDNDTWVIVDRPSEGTVVKSKWVFKEKCDSSGNVRYRARLVARGFSQIKGMDYNETFSPVVRYSTLRLLFALSVQLDLKMNHLDVPTAFLNGDIDECVFMEIPVNSNFKNCENKVLRLKRAIYGLKQSARAWYIKVESSLLKIGFKKSKYEPCLFMKCHNNVKVYVAVFVDDFFVFYNCDNTYKGLRSVLESDFKIKDLGQIKNCLGMNVNVQKNCVTLYQEKFIDNILKRFNMINCKPSVTPMEVNLKLEKAVNNHCSEIYPYQQLVGSLMYLSVLTRPDISYSVSFLSQYNTCYNETHWKHLKRLLRYLQRTKHFGLIFKKDSIDLHGFVDADWASCNIDRRSYTGYCFVLSGCVISYESRKQRTVALSSTESEYMALAEACKEAIYLSNLMSELGIYDRNKPLILYSDSQSSLKLASNPMFHKRTKHIDVRHHFSRECVANNRINISYVPTSSMPADIFTKALCADKHYKFMDLMGIREVN